MVILIAGPSHTGKTRLAQTVLEQYGFPYLSIDHLKMGLIRSGQTALTPMDDDKLTAYLWPILREMIKTAVENGQDLVVEGCYIPYDWEQDLSSAYRRHIRYVCLVMTAAYIKARFADIQAYANVIEHRLEDEYTLEQCLADNAEARRQCEAHGNRYILIEDIYAPEKELAQLLNSNT